jgi:hypothetical protein
MIKYLRLLFLSSFFLPFSKMEAQNYTISGYIEDGNTGERLIAASVYDPITLVGTVTNNYGFFSVTLPAGKVNLVYSYVGYEDKKVEFDLKANIQESIKLFPIALLDEVVIESTKSDRIEESSQMSRIEVPISQIKKIPALFGEVDVLKALQLLPGVQAGNEGQNGIYVRGGSPDQNLILLDGVPVYNVSHVGGLFSVFNADAIKNVSLTKGGFPARFGGRLSSIIEINMKEGNNQQTKVEGGIGLISSRLTVEGPIKKGKTSYMVSGRRTYLDAIAKAFGAVGDGSDFQLYFYDLNTKINHKISNNDHLYLSGYFGRDNFGFSDNFSSGGTESESAAGIFWGNATASARWNHQFSPKLFSNVTAIFSQYQVQTYAKDKYKSANENYSFELKYLSGIRDYGGKIDFDFVPNPKHYIRFGASTVYHIYSPGAATIKDSGSSVLDTLIGTKNQYGTEIGAYIEDDYNLGAFKINGGLHFAGFSVPGKFYPSIQPRLSARYLINNSSSVKAAFSTMTQFVNLLTNEGLSVPTDLWVPSTKNILPQESWQAAVGYAKSLGKEYELSGEVYYKKMNNVISYREGVSFIGLDKNWENKITQGQGWAYGLEVFAQRKVGKTTGWVGYTLSWNTRQFDEINGGKSFDFKYDRRHDFEFVISHQLNKTISFSGTWVYGTGNAITLPRGAYNTGNVPLTRFNFNQPTVEITGDKNSFRMNPYHRLDIGVDFTKKRKRWERTWTISVYNLYNRQNPFFVYIGNEQGTQDKVLKQVNLIPILPSFAYNFKF